MYIYDRQLPVVSSPRNEQAVILRPSHRYYYPSQAAFVMERYSLGQSVPSPVSYNTPGVTFDPQSDYILAPEVMDAVEKLLSTRVPETHLKSLGSNVNPLMIERGLTIFRYDDGRLQVSQVIFGAKPRKTTITGSTTSGGPFLYPVSIETAGPIHTDVKGKVTEARPWLFIHTHPNVSTVPEVPSGIQQENSKLFGDLYALRHEPDHQIGVMTIGVNDVIENFRSTTQTIPSIPFTLALRDPIKKGATDERPTPPIHTHQAAATALRLMFPRSTVSGYYTGDLRVGKATPYLSARQQRK